MTTLRERLKALKRAQLADLARISEDPRLSTAVKEAMRAAVYEQTDAEARAVITSELRARLVEKTETERAYNDLVGSLAALDQEPPDVTAAGERWYEAVGKVQADIDAAYDWTFNFICETETTLGGAEWSTTRTT